MKKAEEYKHLIEMPYPYFSVRKKMSIHDRAAQFSAFDALQGYGEEVEETIRMTDEEFLVDEDERMRINELLCRLRTQKRSDILLTYFVPDARKKGGKYFSTRCRIQLQDTEKQELILSDGTVVPMERICTLESDSEYKMI